MKTRDENHVLCWTRETPPLDGPVWPSLAGDLDGGVGSRYETLPAFFCPHVVTRGRGRVCWEGGERRVQRGDIFCLWPGRWIVYETEPVAPWRFFWFHLQGEGVDAFARACGFAPEGLAGRARDPAGAIRSAADLHAAYGRRGPGDALRVVSALHAFAAACNADESLPAASDAERLVERAVALAEGLLARGVNVGELADRLGVSRATLFRAFRAALGQSPIAYLAGVRLRRAAELLLTTDHKVALIARSAGFRSEKYFITAFRKEHGIPPAAFRTRLRQQRQSAQTGRTAGNA
ncbi:MAG: helix-turn-helix domain-containing protein [Planctomycetota bacterium]